MRESISMAGTRVLLAQRRMGGAVCVVVVVLMSTAVLGMNADGDGSKITCNETTAQTGISVSVDQKTKKVSFVCDTGMKTVLPSEGSSVTKCYTEKGLKEEEELVSLFGQGSQATVVASTGKSKQNSEVTLTLGELPQTMQTIYFVCTDSTASDAESPEGTGDPDASLTVPQAGAEAGGSVSPAPKPGAISGVNSVTPGVGARRVAVVDASHDAFRRSANRAAVGVSKQGESKARCVVTVTVPADPTASTSSWSKLGRQRSHGLPNKARGRPLSINPTQPYQPAIRLNACYLASKHSVFRGHVHHLTPRCPSVMPAACTGAKQSMDLEITSESKSVSFQCDTIIDRLNPENHSDLIFDESCQNPVRLADMLPSAKLATSTSGYTFSVEELPETAGTFCYKCAAASGSEQEGEELWQEPNACYVKIQVPQRSNAASTSAFARSVQALLLGLGVFVAFVQVMY
uniref:SRS domain-containing protein n=1 Tax=Neospora caninum (strain Liverpool) TaxID=572307 RepID=A0A0F7UPP5_NEOCL|nr:TPA: SRS domain-containing protein [Neospora caninum Liverpool]